MRAINSQPAQAAPYRQCESFADAARVDAVISTAARVKMSPGCSNNSPPGPVTPAVFFAGVHTVVSYDEALRYARAVGIARRGQGLDLKTLNAYRRARGEYPFVVRP